MPFSTHRASVSLVGGPDSATVALRASSTRVEGQMERRPYLSMLTEVRQRDSRRRAVAPDSPKSASRGSTPSVGRGLLICPTTYAPASTGALDYRGVAAELRAGEHRRADRLSEARRFSQPNVLADCAVEDHVAQTVLGSRPVDLSGGRRDREPCRRSDRFGSFAPARVPAFAAGPPVRGAP